MVSALCDRLSKETGLMESAKKVKSVCGSSFKPRKSRLVDWIERHSWTNRMQWSVVPSIFLFITFWSSVFRPMMTKNWCSWPLVFYMDRHVPGFDNVLIDNNSTHRASWWQLWYTIGRCNNAASDTNDVKADYVDWVSIRKELNSLYVIRQRLIHTYATTNALNDSSPTIF